MSTDDLQYFSERAAEERQRASEAANPRTRALHLEMAKHYATALRRLHHINEIESSMDTIRRSRDLLSSTKDLVLPR